MAELLHKCNINLNVTLFILQLGKLSKSKSIIASVVVYLLQV